MGLIERFVARARAIGSVPMVVYFPDASNLEGQRGPTAQHVIADLAARGIEVVDPTACMKAAGGVKELIVGGGRGSRPVDAATVAEIGVGEIDIAAGLHYSDAGNARMAHCLAPLLEQRLAKRTSAEVNR